MRSTDSQPAVGAGNPVEDALRNPVCWAPALPATLREIGVAELVRPRGLDFESYGTARMLARSAKETRRIIGRVDPPVGAKGGVMLLECLPSATIAEVGAAGLSVLEVDDSTVPAEIGVLKQAWHLVHAAWPELSSSVGYLVRCVHLLKAPSPEVDCSYSRPDLPFSVFLSVPEHETRTRTERVTEALVHETMHLQLSLVERRIQLVGPGLADALAFSPWRNCERKVQGVLHALHVFVVVQRLWQRAAQRTPSGLDRRFAEARVLAIRDEVTRTQHLAASPGLSREGRQLVRQLLALGGGSVGDAPEG